MRPDDLSVLVRKQEAVLEMRLVSAVDTVTFELTNNLRTPGEAVLQCGEGGVDITVPVQNNGEGSLSITLPPMVTCTVLLDIF